MKSMVQIAPFQGITYNKDTIPLLDKVMSPPYDIISEKMQQKLYEQHPNNFVRLILGKQSPTDTEQDNRYSRARKLFDQWQQQSILLQSEKKAIYPYKIDYMVDHASKTMNGFFILLRLDPEYKQVKAHEKTLSKPKEDRLNLMRAVHANLEPIQLLYMDTQNTIQKKIETKLHNPMVKVKGYDGFTHRLWQLDDEQVISSIVNELRDKILFIADGHHRYQTAINYAEEQRKKTGKQTDDASFNYRMVILVNMFDQGLAILPTHRLITMPGVHIERLLGKLREFFSVEQKEIQKTNYEEIGEQIMQDIATRSGHRCALYANKKYYVLTLQDETVMNRFASDRSQTWRTLDVSILHKIILEQVMGISEKTLEDHVKYTRVNGEAIQLVDEGRFDLSFLMNPTKIEELKVIAEGGEHMPQKSTYFLPKMLSGLVMYKM